jgi:amino acid adenylation domain-containing protein
VEARQFDYAPLLSVQAWSEVPRGTALFESLFIFESYDQNAFETGYTLNGEDESESAGFRIEESSAREMTNYPLTLTISPSPAISITMRYERARYSFERVARLLDRFTQIAATLVDSADQPLARLTLLPGPERRQLLEEWSGASIPEPADPFVHELFVRQAGDCPDAIAAAFQDRQTTYGELDRVANKLAHYLRKLGSGPEVRVAVCLERGLELMVALLAVCKSGGAYVPLDPEHPTERLSFVLSDSAVPIVVTQKEYLGRLSPTEGTRTVVLDAVWEEIHTQPGDAPLVSLFPENLAYVMYTSGSTGRPKGTSITHRALGNFLVDMASRDFLKRGETVLAVTTPTFDISILELFLPLLVGGRAVIVEANVAVDGFAVAEWLSRSGASLFQATPASWRLLVEAGWLGEPGLTMLCGGEALDRHLAATLLPLGASVWNMYGPTETTVWSSVGIVTSSSESPALGSPISNTRFYVLDPEFELVPIGALGELYIAGVGLARGYHCQSALTSERLLPDPFSDSPGMRMYRTGDLVRRRLDGSLDYLGRADRQVKVRGFRMELDEIEAVLREHPAVQNAAVLVRERAKGDNGLAAYVVTHSGGPLDTHALRAALRRKLPAYMIPDVFVQLERLPLTPNGKLNRRELPVSEEQGTSDEYIAPRNETEAAVAKVYAEVLGLDRVSVRGNFFELGGHSLLAMQAVARLLESMGVRIPVRAFFRHSEVERLAEEIDLLRNSANVGERSPSVEPPFPTPDEQLLARLDDLREDEIDRLLDELHEVPPVSVADCRESRPSIRVSG